jgi:acyl carrier protein
MSERVNIDDLRALIISAAPDPAQARPVERCGPDDLLDRAIPFSSVIVLGVVVAVEDRYGVRVTRRMLARALEGGATLNRLATMIEGARVTLPEVD